MALGASKQTVCSIKFSRADIRVKMRRSFDVSGTNSVRIFRVCWWFGNTETDDQMSKLSICCLRLVHRLTYGRLCRN